jgi:hypothetical protein
MACHDQCVANKYTISHILERETSASEKIRQEGRGAKALGGDLARRLRRPLRRRQVLHEPDRVRKGKPLNECH